MEWLVKETHTVIIEDLQLFLDYMDQVFAAFGEQFRMHALTDRVNEARAGNFVVAPRRLEWLV